MADLASKLLNPVIERRAGMTLDLISAWPQIAGERHAQFSRPEKFNWPRKIHEDDAFKPAVLIIACEQVHAMYLQHDCDGLIERINTYFGFAAVSRIKLVQKPLPRQAERNKPIAPELKAPAEDQLRAMLENVEDEALRHSLQRLGRGVLRKSKGQK